VSLLRRSHQSNCLTSFSYFDGFIYNLKYFLQYHGDDGKNELNAVCPTHTAILTASTKFSYCGTEVKDGQLQLLFHPNNLGTNISNLAQKLADTLSAAPQPDGAPSLSYAARHSIKTDYTPTISALLEKTQKILQNPDFKFEPDFDTLGAKLKGAKDGRDDWEANLGSFAKQYLESFTSYLEYNKFESDEMLREGLQEVVTKNTLHLKIVDQLATSQNGYNEIVIDDGELVIQVRQAYDTEAIEAHV
jgi:hypothetical protein